MEKNAADFQSWVDRLVHACLPLDLQKKLITLQPLTKEEARKYVQVVQLVAQAKSLKKQDELHAHLDRNTERILKAIRSEGEKPFDKRSPQERRLIDLAAIHYARRRYLDGLDIPKSDCIRHVWKKHGDTNVFRDCDAFANAVRYDLDRYYDLDVLIARAKTECIPSRR